MMEINVTINYVKREGFKSETKQLEVQCSRFKDYKSINKSKN